MTKKLSREEAEKVADEVMAISEETRRKNPGMFFTDEEREVRGYPPKIPDSYFRDRIIDSLMNPED